VHNHETKLTYNCSWRAINYCKDKGWWARFNFSQDSRAKKTVKFYF